MIVVGNVVLRKWMVFFYNEKENVIVFTQDGDEFDSYHKEIRWKCLHSDDVWSTCISC